MASATCRPLIYILSCRAAQEVFFVCVAQPQELIDYFKDRRVWLIEPDESSDRVLPYSPQSDR
jgi:hypothetical protein